jgi:hypothetical protein
MKKTFANATLETLKPRGILNNHREKEEASTPKKRGRPQREADPLKSKLTLYFTDAEMDVIKSKAGLVPLAKHLRHYLSEAGYFKNS